MPVNIPKDLLALPPSPPASLAVSDPLSVCDPLAASDPLAVTFVPRPADLPPSRTATLAPQIAAALNLRPGAALMLKLHKVVMPLRVDVNPRMDPATIWLPRQAFRVLKIPAHLPLRLRPRPDGSVEPGPFIGILSPPRKPGNPYAEQTTFFIRLLRYGRQHHIPIYIFGPDDVHFGKRIIRGWDYLPGKGWVQRPYPLPHTVYDRSLLTRKIRAVQRRFERMGTPLFNSLMGSKWWQYRVLAKDPRTAVYLPETRKIRSAADLAYMLNRHGSVYVKAAHGGKGMGIWQISQVGHGRYLVRRTDRRCRVSSLTTSNLGAVAQVILRSRRQPYIVQARLWLMRWQGRIFDIRVLVQKDGTGQWQVTGAGLRVGRKGSIVSNLYGGGQTAPLEPVLNQLLQQRSPESVREECYRLALTIATLMDEACRNVGELGIDLALDRSERLWFLEANSRTGRNVFRRLGSPQLARWADTRPIAYAVHLAGFTVPARSPSRSPSM